MPNDNFDRDVLLGETHGMVKGMSGRLERFTAAQERRNGQVDRRLRALEDTELRRKVRAGSLGALAGGGVTLIVALVEAISNSKT